MELVLSEEYVQHSSHDKFAFFKDRLQTSNIAFASEPLSMSGMSNSNVVIRPSLEKCLVKTGKNLSFSSQLPSVAIPNYFVKSG